MHVVQAGEHIAAIAAQYGVENFLAIWDHANNAELRAKRESPFILAPGDELFIPDLVQRVFDVATGAIHEFTVWVDKLGLHLRLLDVMERPRRLTTVTVDAQGAPSEAKTDEDGKVVAEIPRTALVASVVVSASRTTVAGENVIDTNEFVVRIGALDPVEEETGWVQRLNNLGYFVPAEEERTAGDEVSSAVEEFQCDHGLKVTGEMDGVTQAKLKELHGV